MITFIVVSVYLFCFAISFYALSAIKFELFCKVNEPAKVQLLLLLLAIGLGCIVAQFILELTVYH